MRKIFSLLALLSAFTIQAEYLRAQPGPSDRKVSGPTRLDWEFALHGFKPDERALPANYDSTKQKYQLYVPKDYDKKKSWPLVVFISPGQTPTGWKSWQTLCEQEGVFFASPYDAGNSTRVSQRTRIILDVMDDIRRQFRIDPDQTYISGFSGGGRMACAIGFSLPEYFGGVIPVCGTNPIAGPTYLRHRIDERLSVAFITGEKDINRKENDEYMFPWFQEIGIRSKLWIMPKVGHELPSPSAVNEAYAGLTEDLKRRRADAKARPKLAVTPDDTPTAKEQADRFIETAQIDLEDPMRTCRGAMLLQGAVARWGKTDAGKKAQSMLKGALKDKTLVERISDQGSEDEIKALSAQAKATERFGQTAQAIAAWQLLADNYKGTPIATTANEHIKRLKGKAK